MTAAVGGTTGAVAGLVCAEDTAGDSKAADITVNLEIRFQQVMLIVPTQFQPARNVMLRYSEASGLILQFSQMLRSTSG
jgi:hypothetical protein